MSSFYGNIISHTPRFSFDIAKVYPNRATMEEESLTDGVNFSQYVLINYNIDKNGRYNESNYSKNLNKDQEIYGLVDGSSKDFLVNYNQTVWQKSYDQNNNLYYRAIDKLHATLPTFQDMSAKNFPVEYMPVDYEGFGIEQLYGYYYTNDEESAAIFNNRYLDSEIKINVSEDGSWSVEETQKQIEDKIEEINEIIETQQKKVENLQSELNTDFEDIDTYQEIVQLYQKVIESYDEVTSFIINQLDIEQESTEINNNYSSLESSYNTLNSYKDTYSSIITNINQISSDLESAQFEISNLITEINNEIKIINYNLSEQSTDDNNNQILGILHYTKQIKDKATNLDKLINTLKNNAVIDNDTSTVTLTGTQWDTFIQDYESIGGETEENSTGFTAHAKGIETIVSNINSSISKISNYLNSTTTSSISTFNSNINFGGLITETSNLTSLQNKVNTTYNNILNYINTIKTYQNNIKTKENDVLINLNEYKKLLEQMKNNLDILMEEQSEYDNKDIINYTINKIDSSIQLINDLNSICVEYIEESEYLIELVDKQSYYTEMLAWFKIFKQTITESYIHYQTSNDLWSSKQKTYGTSTLEYPIK